MRLSAVNLELIYADRLAWIALEEQPRLRNTGLLATYVLMNVVPTLVGVDRDSVTWSQACDAMRR